MARHRWRHILLAPLLALGADTMHETCLAEDKPAANAAPSSAVVTPPKGDGSVIPSDYLTKPPQLPDGAALVPFDPKVFAPDPNYADKPYDPQAQTDIYGAKHANPTQRPLLELGRELYQYGPFQPAPTLLGSTNPMNPQLMVFGDYRTAVAYNDNGNKEQGSWAQRLNLDVDMRFTSTERVHAFFRPLDKGNHFTSYDFSGEDHGFDAQVDGNVDALFFEGDLGNMIGGLTGTHPDFDLPVTAGLIPLLFQNGIWMVDAFEGAAFTIPARNSPWLDISNMDVTFFVGLDKVTTGAMPGQDHAAAIYGFNTFIEAAEGFIEAGYAYTEDKQHLGRDYHNFSIAYTRRYWDLFSNSVRIVSNMGQNPNNGAKQTADGFVVLVENSFITKQPSTVVPYANFFAGFDHPQSVARDAGAGGILLNTGILFETDGLTGFPRLDDTAANTFGGAIGLDLIGSNLDNQLVLEIAYVGTRGDATDRTAPGDEYGIGIRYQYPITNAIILRFDVMYGLREHAEDLSGARFEIRYKF